MRQLIHDWGTCSPVRGISDLQANRNRSARLGIPRFEPTGPLETADLLVVIRSGGRGELNGLLAARTARWADAADRVSKGLEILPVAVVAVVGNPVADDPILSLGAASFFVLAGAFFIGALLFQLRFRAIWCPFACEAAVLYFYFSGFYRFDPHMLSLSFFHAVGLPLFLVPTYLGYYFNKHIIHS